MIRDYKKSDKEQLLEILRRRWCYHPLYLQ